MTVLSYTVINQQDIQLTYVYPHYLLLCQELTLYLGSRWFAAKCTGLAKSVFLF